MKCFHPGEILGAKATRRENSTRDKNRNPRAIALRKMENGRRTVWKPSAVKSHGIRMRHHLRNIDLNTAEKWLYTVYAVYARDIAFRVQRNTQVHTYLLGAPLSYRVIGNKRP